MQLLNTLYVTTEDSYLRLDNDTLRVEVDRETKLRVPLHHLTAVVCFTTAATSGATMRRTRGGERKTSKSSTTMAAMPPSESSVAS